MTVVEFDALDSARLFELLKDNEGPVNAISTPFPSWNSFCREEGGRQGIALGWYVVLGGATGFGKTTIAMNMAGNAVKVARNVGFVNFEMSQKQLAGRFLSIATGAHRDTVEPGTRFNMDALRRATNQVEGIPGTLYTNRRPIVSLGQAEQSMRTLREAGCDLLIVDYVQLVRVDGMSGHPANQRVSDTLRDFAHEHGAAVVSLGQVGTGAIRSKESPGLGSLDGGAKWAMDADQFVLIDHTAHERHEADPFTGFGRMVLIKNRHGPTGGFDIRWDWRTLQCAELTEDRRDVYVSGPGSAPAGSYADYEDGDKEENEPW